MGTTPLYAASTYKYLGVYLTPDLSWETHQQKVVAKAQRRKDQLVWVGGRHAGDPIEPANLNRLYEMVTRPGFEYASEIWGADPLPRLESIQYAMGRRILGCGPHVANDAVLGDLGWLPLRVRRDVALLRMWGRIMRRPLASIVRQAYNGLHSLFLLRHGRPPGYEWGVQNWVQRAHYLMTRRYPTLTQYWQAQSVPVNVAASAQRNRDIWRDIVLAAVRERAGERWANRVWNKQKLVTYRLLVGRSPTLQPYIRESPAGDRITRLITGLRTGTNALEVERGRWTGVPREERVCTRCVGGGVEDERHFLLRCPNYRLERADLASQLEEVYGITWEGLTETQRLHTVLLGNGMPRALLEDYHRRRGGSAVLRLVRRFVFRAHTRRELALEGPVNGGA